jgi:hypothetical protein
MTAKVGTWVVSAEADKKAAALRLMNRDSARHTAGFSGSSGAGDVQRVLTQRGWDGGAVGVVVAVLLALSRNCGRERGDQSSQALH